MIKILIKYLVLEECIDSIINNAVNNFQEVSLKIGDRFKQIMIIEEECEVIFFNIIILDVNNDTLTFDYERCSSLTIKYLLFHEDKSINFNDIVMLKK